MRDCEKCVYAKPYGGENDNRCSAWSCEFIDRHEAIEAYKSGKPKEGKWIELAMTGEYKCSVCGRGSRSENTFQLIPKVYWNYCPNCGAKMIGE